MPETKPKKDIQPDKQDKIKKLDKDKSKEPMVVGDFLKLYLVPVIMIVVSLILIFVVILPLVNSVTTSLSEIGKEKDEYNRQLEIRTRREKLGNETSQQEADLAKINKLIPLSKTGVVNFSEKIKTQAEKDNLEVQSSLVGEAVITNPDVVIVTDDGIEKGLDLAELPAEFTLRGKFNDMKSFLTHIFGANDFIIVKEMELRKQTINEDDPEAQKFNVDPSDSWAMSVTFVKYQFRQKSNTSAQDLKDAYFAIPESARANEEVLKFINENYK